MEALHSNKMEALHQNYICKLGGSAFQQKWRRLCNKNANSGDDYIPQKKKKKAFLRTIYANVEVLHQMFCNPAKMGGPHFSPGLVVF